LGIVVVCTRVSYADSFHRPRFRGEEVDTAGDGLLATFDGPARRRPLRRRNRGLSP
jgi:hypothetical protein